MTVTSSIHTWSTSRWRTIEHGACSSGPTARRQEELGVEVRALIEAQQLQRRRADAQDPARDEARVLGEEAVLAPLVGAHVAEAVADDERAAVQDAEGALRHWVAAARQRGSQRPCGRTMGADEHATAPLTVPADGSLISLRVPSAPEFGVDFGPEQQGDVGQPQPDEQDNRGGK